MEDLGVQLDKERRENQNWRTYIIEEQERNRELQEQLTTATKERHQAQRGEAAKKRECDRLQRQLDEAKADSASTGDYLKSRSTTSQQENHDQREDGFSD